MKEITNSRHETQELGIRLSGSLRAGDVVLLTGDLGAGKSELARGIARGLGITEAVPSPSFTILNVYSEGSVPLYHFDWYRIGNANELTEMGLEEYIGGDGIALIEWHERAPEILPDDTIEAVITPLSEYVRSIEICTHGKERRISL